MAKEKKPSTLDAGGRVKVPMVYLYIYKKLIEHLGFKEVQTRHVLEILRRTVYQVPKKYHYYILQEMEDHGLIVKLNKQKFEILRSREKELEKLDNFVFW